jgi:hypothetical protein
MNGLVPCSFPLLVITLACLGLSPQGSGTPAARAKPDFTGQWVLVTPPEAAGDAAPELSVRQWFEHTTSVRGDPIDLPRVTIERQFQGGVRSETYRIGVIEGTVGGVAAGVSVPSWQTRFAVKWDGDRLVIETGRYFGSPREKGPYSEHGEVWDLDPQGRLVMTITDRDSTTESRTIELTYRKAK